MRYKTPPGVDETEVPLPPEYQYLLGKVTAHTYRNGVILKGRTLAAGVLDEISNKINRNKSVVINITGPPGVGKSWFAMAFALLFDSNFMIIDTPKPSPNQDDGQVCFTRAHIRHLIGEDSPLKPGQAVMLDEAHFGMGSRTFQNREQVDMVNLISAIRSKGFMLLIVTLHSSMLDKIPREFVVNYEFAVKDEGVAKPYFKWYPTLAKKQFYKGKYDLYLPIPDQFNPETGIGCDYPGCLKCRFLHGEGDDRCPNIRAVYERRKNEFINEMSRNGTEEKQVKRTREERQQLIIENKQFLFKNNRGLIDLGSLQGILAHYDEPNGNNTARSIKTWIEINHPELVKTLYIRPKNP